MQAGEQTLSRSYHTLLRLILLRSLFPSNKEEHQTACNQQNNAFSNPFPIPKTALISRLRP